MIVFVVFWYIDVESVEFIGVFDSEEKAIAACITPQHGYGRAEMNKTLNDVSESWPDFVYPLAA